MWQLARYRSVGFVGAVFALIFTATIPLSATDESVFVTALPADTPPDTAERPQANEVPARSETPPGEKPLPAALVNEECLQEVDPGCVVGSLAINDVPLVSKPLRLMALVCNQAAIDREPCTIILSADDIPIYTAEFPLFAFGYLWVELPWTPLRTGKISLAVACAWRSASWRQNEDELETERSRLIVPVEVREPNGPDLYIKEFTLLQKITCGETIKVDLSVANDSSFASPETPLVFETDEGDREGAVVTVPADGQEQRSFTWKPRTPGIHRLTARIIYREDPIERNNTLSYLVDVAPQTGKEEKP